MSTSVLAHDEDDVGDVHEDCAEHVDGERFMLDAAPGAEEEEHEEYGEDGMIVHGSGEGANHHEQLESAEHLERYNVLGALLVGRVNGRLEQKIAHCLYCIRMGKRSFATLAAASAHRFAETPYQLDAGEDEQPV